MSAIVKIDMPTASAFDYEKLPADTADILRKQAEHIRAGIKKTTSAIIEIGRNLIAVKDHLDHGQFADWVLAECGFSIGSAENYMRAANFAEGKIATVTNLPPATVYKLAAKNTPVEIVTDILGRVERGEKVAGRAVTDALAQVRRQMQQEERDRQAAMQPKARARRNAEREAEQAREEERQRGYEEEAKVAAVSIIEKLGKDNAQFLLKVLSEGQQHRILSHLKDLVQAGGSA